MSNFLEIAAHDLDLTRYLTFAAFTVLLYDHVVTISDEISLIWPAKNGLLKLLFLFNRYTVPLVVCLSCIVMSGEATFLSTKVCQSYIIFVVCYEVVALLTTTFVVTTRAYALWRTYRYSFVLLGALWGVHMVADLVVSIQNLMDQVPHVVHEPIFNICFANVRGSWIVWLNGILFNAIIIILLMWAWLSTPRTEQTPLMALIVRDGCVYFIAIFIAMLFNLLVWKYGRSTQAVLPYFAVWVTTTIAQSRLLLSLKDVQGPEDWGQQAKIRVPDVELSLVQPDRGVVSVLSRFSEDDDPPKRPSDAGSLSRKTPTMTHLGRYDV
ncbi:hypothetical protein BDV93DRAFT_606905 [Ceratobasidium sp. AG-I]|nr:hypothetical protein BDV93DRAFT_606905 [Ceratobasidium sp. AG-I]